jgi:coproporphyrinogen III oxidase
MLTSIAQSYAESYAAIIKRRSKTPFSAEDKEFQSLRRGRYVEFNLVNDRGTAFGLQSNGRIPSILASLPLNASWKYKKEKTLELREKKLVKTINRDWNAKNI